MSSVTSSSHSVPSIVQTWTFRTLPAKIFSSCTNIVAAAAAAAGLQLSPLKTLREPAVYSPESRSVPRLNLPWQQTRAHGLIRTFSYRPICTTALLGGLIFSDGADRDPHSRSCGRDACSMLRWHLRCARATAIGTVQQCACVSEVVEYDWWKYENMQTL